MKNHISILLISTLSIMLMACTSSGEYSGTYTSSFERSEFQPDGKNEYWWTKGESLVNILNCLTTRDIESQKGIKQSIYINGSISFRIKCSGRRSTFKGHYGHLGSYDREFIIEKIIEINGESPDKFCVSNEN